MGFFTTSLGASILTFVGTMIVALISIYNNNKSRKYNLKLVQRTDLIEKRKSIEKKLDTLYRPLWHYLEQSRTLHGIFVKGKPKGFRTLTYLLNPEQEYEGEKVILSNNDRALLKKIIDIGIIIEELIHKKGYLMGDDSRFVGTYEPGNDYKDVQYDKGLTLTNLLISHLITIRMAFRDEITGQIDIFERYVFPHEINDRVNNKITELEEQFSNYESKIEQLIKK